MFHRVLPLNGEAFAHAEQEYAVGVEAFECSLTFFKRHYTVVSLAQVREAAGGGAPLPDHAMLITFDDGWQDNVVHAEPMLRQHGLRATMFVNVDAIRQADARWWQDALVEISLQQPQALRALSPTGDFFGAARQLLDLPLNERLSRLKPWLKYDPRERQMLTLAGLQSLDRGVWDLGSHGSTHVPFTHAPDLDLELSASAAQLSAWLGQTVDALAFPHGRYSPEIGHQATAQAGPYRLVFSSDQRLNRTNGPHMAPILGRIHIPARACHSDKAMAQLLWERRSA